MNLYSNTNILIRILTILRVSTLPTRLNVCAYGFRIYTYMDMYILTRIHRKNKISHYSIGVSTMGALGSTFSRRVTKTQKPRSKKGHFHTLVVLLNATVIFFWFLYQARFCLCIESSVEKDRCEFLLIFKWVLYVGYCVRFFCLYLELISLLLFSVFLCVINRRQLIIVDSFIKCIGYC